MNGSVLTKDELTALNPDQIYNINTFVLHNELWGLLDTRYTELLGSPRRLEFNGKIREKLSDKKGIYMFFVEPDFPFSPKVSYLMYVGRVIGENTFNKRFYEYVNAIGNKNVRRNIQLLTNLWPGRTWVYVYELDLPDDEITKIEDDLIDHVVPPMNNRFKLEKAFNSRSIY